MLNMSATAFVFPGQGSQIVGMGKDIAGAYAAAREVFEQADDIIGFPLSRLCFEGPEEGLNDTINTQPALYVCSMAILRALQTELPDLRPGYTAGHSLGELTALTAAGALDFANGVWLVRERGRLMKEAGEQHPGGMAALLGLEPEQVREICAAASEEAGAPVVMANDNCPGQIVISGDVTALEIALTRAQQAGARRSVRLAVSIAPHSPLMETASAAFKERVESTSFTTPQVPVYANISTNPMTSVAAIREELEDQLTQSVHWTQLVQRMIADGAETFVEIGSRDVLTGLLRRIDRSRTGLVINSLETLQQFVQNAS